MPEKFLFDKLKELSELYQDVKKKVVLAEEIYDAAPFTLMNEVRASYDHVLRPFVNNKQNDLDELEKQIVSASRHLKRAGYDACEFIVGGYVAKINVILNKYSASSLHTVLGSRYNEVKIFLNDVSSQYLVEARIDKNSETKIEDDVEIDMMYPVFSEIIPKVADCWVEITNAEFLLREHKKETRKDKIKWFVYGIIATAIFSIMFFYFEMADVFGFSSNKAESPDKIEVFPADSVSVI